MRAGQQRRSRFERPASSRCARAMSTCATAVDVSVRMLPTRADPPGQRHARVENDRQSFTWTRLMPDVGRLIDGVARLGQVVGALAQLGEDRNPQSREASRRSDLGRLNHAATERRRLHSSRSGPVSRCPRTFPFGYGLPNARPAVTIPGNRSLLRIHHLKLRARREWEERSRQPMTLVTTTQNVASGLLCGHTLSIAVIHSLSSAMSSSSVDETPACSAGIAKVRAQRGFVTIDPVELGLRVQRRRNPVQSLGHRPNPGLIDLSDWKVPELGNQISGDFALVGPDSAVGPHLAAAVGLGAHRLKPPFCILGESDRPRLLGSSPSPKPCRECRRRLPVTASDPRVNTGEPGASVGLRQERQRLVILCPSCALPAVWAHVPGLPAPRRQLSQTAPCLSSRSRAPLLVASLIFSSCSHPGTRVACSTASCTQRSRRLEAQIPGTLTVSSSVPRPVVARRSRSPPLVAVGDRPAAARRMRTCHSCAALSVAKRPSLAASVH